MMTMGHESTQVGTCFYLGVRGRWLVAGSAPAQRQHSKAAGGLTGRSARQRNPVATMRGGREVSPRNRVLGLGACASSHDGKKLEYMSPPAGHDHVRDVRRDFARSEKSSPFSARRGARPEAPSKSLGAESAAPVGQAGARGSTAKMGRDGRRCALVAVGATCAAKRKRTTCEREGGLEAAKSGSAVRDNFVCNAILAK